MKKLVLSLLLVPVNLLSQVPVNGDSLVVYFGKLINEYRLDNKLVPIKIDVNLKGFTESWSLYQSKVGSVSHGDGDNSFQKRVELYPNIPSNKRCLENCAMAYTPVTPISKNTNIQSSQTELLPYIDKMMRGKQTQMDYAIYALIIWKNSPEHNSAMLDPEIKTYYVSASTNNGRTYFSFIGVD
jgi:uncharacterized protein YkwD